MVTGQLVSGLCGAEIALALDTFEAFVVYLLAAGCLLAGLFIFHEDQMWMAHKYTAVGQGLAILFLGISLPVSVVSGALLQRRVTAPR